MQTIKQYVLNNFETTEMQDIQAHGMVSGFGSLIYYKDTCAFHDEYEIEIWNMLQEDAENMDMTICEFIASFNAQKNVGSMDQFKNLLCWYSVERTICDILNDNESDL